MSLRHYVIQGLVITSAAFATTALADDYISAGPAFTDGNTGYEVHGGQQPQQGLGFAGDAMLRYTSFDGVLANRDDDASLVTLSAGVGVGMGIGGGIDHSISAVIGPRVDHYTNGDSDTEVGGYGALRYEIRPVPRIQLGTEVAYTNVGEDLQGNSRDGVSVEPHASFFINRFFSVEARYLADLGDVEIDDRAYVGLTLTY